MRKEALKLFKEYANLPPGCPIEKPNDFVAVYSDFVFTRKTLKHLAEKGRSGCALLYLIPDILEFPDCILKISAVRNIAVKYLPGVPRPYAVITESRKIIVTVFHTDKKYLKRFKILWRTRSS